MRKTTELIYKSQQMNQNDLLQSTITNPKIFNDFYLYQVEKYGNRYKSYREEYKKAGRYLYTLAFPLYIMLEQTYRCNLSCVGCVHGHRQATTSFAPDTALMPWDLLRRVVEEAKRYNCPLISMHSNDEPLLVPDIINRVAYVKDNGFMDIFLTTNGLLLAPQLTENLIAAGLTHILFSIDATTETTYQAVRRGGPYQGFSNQSKWCWNIEKRANSPSPYCVQVLFKTGSISMKRENLSNLWENWWISWNFRVFRASRGSQKI